MHRSVVIIVGALTLLLVNVAMFTAHTSKELAKYEKGFVDITQGRIKKSAPYVLGKLLKGTKLIVEKGDFRLYSKPGGYAKASAEFKALKLNNPRNTKGGLQGTRGDKVITLRESRVYGDGVIEIWTVRYGSIEPVKVDRIKYSLWARK